MVKAWNIISNQLGDNAFGHPLWETRLLSEELQRRGTEVRLFGHASIRADDFPGARARPVFQLHHRDSVSSDPVWSNLENFVVHNMAFERALGRIDPANLEDAATVFLDLSQRHMLGAIRWLARFEDAARPKAAMVLKGHMNWSMTNPAMQMYRRVWASCPSAVKQRTTLCTRSEIGARNYEQILGMKPHVLPSPLAPTEREVRASFERIGPPTGPLVVAFLAGARRERGAALIPDVVRQCSPLGVQFLVQVTDVTDMGGELPSFNVLRDRPEVRFHDGALPRADYNDWIAQSVVLLPYDTVVYQGRSSGVYLEAKCFGAPVIVSPGSWMAEEVSRLGNGLILEERSVASITKCIARAQAELPALRERAARCAAEYRRSQGVDRCVDAIENLFDAR